MELDPPLAQAQPGSPSSTPSDPAAGPQNGGSPAAKPEDSSIPELELIKEEESVSIAIGLGREQPISESPSNVYVITDEDIRHSGAIDIPTVLRRIPGVEVMQVTGADFNVSVRGDNQLRANKLLVLIDGRSVYLDVQGEVLWKMFPITLPEIKRIEVLKGPASALYGFNAFDGVINIITKSPDEMKGTTIQFGGGAYGTISSAAIYANRYKDLGYRLSIGRDQNNQWRSGDSLAFRDHKFNIQTEYALSGQSKISVSGGFVDVNRYDGPLVGSLAISQTPSQGYAHVVYERPNFFLRSYWTGFSQPSFIGANPSLAPFIQATDLSGNPHQFLTWNSYNIEGQHSIELWAANRLTYGVNYRHNTVSSNFLDQFTREDRVGIYVQDEWRVTQTLTAIAGVRYDMDTFINPTVSPRFSLVYAPHPNHTFRAGVAQAYRPPTIFEEHSLSAGITRVPGIPTPFPGFFQGSNHLTPEKITSYDLGYQGWYFKHRVRLRADLFFNHISDLISDTRIIPPVTRSLENGGVADIYGGEAGLEFLATSWLTGFANFSYQEIGQHAGGDGRNARGAPRYKANAGLRGEWENGLNGEAAVYYVGQATYPINPFFLTASRPPFNGVPAPSTLVGSYVLLNLRGAYRFWQEKRSGREAEVAITAFNAMNDKHRENPIGDLIGSRVMGWLTIKY
jgi:iron complex outermembrane receptor protein